MALNFCRKTSRFGRVIGRIFEKEQNKKKSGSIKGVTYEGMIRVTDEELFKELLVSGIGRGKAYGMGLFTIVHI